MPATDAELDRLKARIQGLRAKTIDNGCTEDEAMSAAAKVAELLDRYDLSVSDVDWRESPCDSLAYETQRKKRIPLEDCVGAIAHFCDCRVWREKNAVGEARYVFFGLRSDIAVAHYLADLIDGTVRAELGRYKTGAAYLRLRHQDRNLANASFALGMVASIAARLDAMKADRDAVNRATGRDLVVVKTGVVEAEMSKLGLNLKQTARRGRTVSMDAYAAGDRAGASFTVTPALGPAARGGRAA